MSPLVRTFLVLTILGAAAFLVLPSTSGRVGAASPSTFEPFAPQQRLQASDAAAGDIFGHATAVNGDTAFVGAYRDNNGRGVEAGAVYVFTRANGVWTQQQKLTASQGAANDFFGFSVALAGDTALVGAVSSGGRGAGSVYVFQRVNGVWVEQQRLQASDGALNDQFGYSVSLSSDTAVISADADDDGGQEAGAVYVFGRSAGTWTQQQKLTASDTAAGDNFGNSVSLSGDSVIIGAWQEDNAGGNAAGSAYVFTRNGGVWAQQQKLTASDASALDFFGTSVSLDGDTAVVGASLNDSADSDAGAAYVFTRSGGVWTQQQRLTSSDIAAGDNFGGRVCLSGDTLVVTSLLDDVGGFVDAGSAYVFTRSGGVWTQQQKLTASDAAANDSFGISVSLNGRTLLVGSYQDDNSGGADAGSAYVFIATPANVAPVVSAGSDQVIDEGLAFGLTASFTDADASDTHTATVDWGEGSPAEAVAVAEPSGQSPGAINAVHTFSAPGNYTVTVTVNDSAGGSGSDTLQVAVVVPDNAAPALTLPEDIETLADSPAGKVVTFEATATDDVDGAVPVNCAPASGSPFPLGETPVVCTAADSHGNTSQGSFRVTVSAVGAVSKTKRIDFERYPGPDGLFGTADDDCTSDGDVIGDRYSSMGVRFRLTNAATPGSAVLPAPSDDNSPTIRSLDYPYVPGSPRALYPKSKNDRDLGRGDNALKNVVIRFDRDVSRVRISGLDADEDVRLRGFNAAGVQVDTDLDEGGSGRAVNTVEVSAGASQGYIRSVVIDLTTTSEFCCDGGPEFYDLLEFDEVEPGVTNTRSVDFERYPGPDNVPDTADDTPAAVGDSVSSQYAPLGVTFSLKDGSAPVVRVRGARVEGSPHALYLANAADFAAHGGDQRFLQDLVINFTTPVSRVRIAAIDADEPWVLRAYNRAGAQVATKSQPARGNSAVFSEVRVDSCDTDNLIWKVVIDIRQDNSESCCDAGPEYFDLLSFDVVDTAAPVSTASVSPPPNADGWNNTDVTVTLSASDNASGVGVSEILHGVGGAAETRYAGPFVVSAEGMTAVTFHATDGANAEEPHTLTLKIDKTAPVVTASATAGGNPYAPGSPTNRDVTVSFDCSDPTSGVASVTAPVVVSAEGVTQKVVGVCRDRAGNESTTEFGPVDIDKTAPVLSVPAGPLFFEAAGPQGGVATYSATATDNVDGPLAVNCTPDSGTTFPLGDTNVTCQTTDAHGNTSTAVFVVRVRDTLPPTLSLPTPEPVEATGPSGATVTYAATAHDTVSGDVSVSCAPPSGSTFALGKTTVTCHASDGSGNPASGSFEVEVVDTTPPALTLPSPAPFEATGPAGAAVTYAASASDVVDGSVAVSCSRPSGDTFPVGTTQVTCSASDARGNTTTGSFDVTVRDTTAPAISNVPSHMVLEATGPAGAAASWPAPTATDIVDGAVAVTCVPASGGTFPIGTTSVLCSASDSRGNTSTAGFSVTVRDTTAPSLTVPADIVAEATSPLGAAVTYAASAADVVDGPVAVSCSPASGSTFALGTTVVTCAAKDAHQNPASRTFNVLVRDTTAPVLSVPASFAVNATSPSGATVTYAASASDVADPSPTLACAPASGNVFPVGTTTVTCTARDASGNTATASFQVTVKGASTQIDDLISLIRGLNLPAGLTNSLVNKLGNAQGSLDRGNTNAACSQLGSFINEVEAQRGKELTNAQADQLVGDANRVRAVMGCL
jgi:hypothetical protein